MPAALESPEPAAKRSVPRKNARRNRSTAHLRHRGWCHAHAHRKTLEFVGLTHQVLALNYLHHYTFSGRWAKNPVEERVQIVLGSDNADSQLPAVLPATPPRPPLVPERADFLEGDAPAADKVQAFLARALAATGGTDRPPPRPWSPGSATRLLSNHSVKAYGRDLVDFVRHMQAQGVTPRCYPQVSPP